MFVDFFTEPKNYLVVLAGLSLIACSPSDTKSDQLPFEYLSVDGNTIRTVHGLKYQMQADESFKTADAAHRTDTFFDVPYEISSSAFIRKDAAIMIQAERVKDGSGASDYSGQGASGWPNANFRSDGAQCMEVPLEEVEGEHDLEWLRANGFEPTGTLMLGQYYETTPDSNDEIVISLVHHVETCDDTEANMQKIEALKSSLTISASN